MSSNEMPPESEDEEEEKKSEENAPFHFFNTLEELLEYTYDSEQEEEDTLEFYRKLATKGFKSAQVEKFNDDELSQFCESEDEEEISKFQQKLIKKGYTAAQFDSFDMDQMVKFVEDEDEDN